MLFERTHALSTGPRVRLRLARPGDRDGVERLLRARNASAFELGIRRLLRFDPGRRTVLAAFAPLDGIDTLVGIAAADHGEDVDTLVVDERLTAGLGELLVRELATRTRHRAA